MKVEKTRKLLYEMVMISDVQPPRELVRGAEDELTRIEELAAKGMRAEQAEREIEAEIERFNSQLHEHYDYGTSRAVGAFRFALDRLKGVE